VLSQRQAASFREHRCETEQLCRCDVGGCGENQSISLVIAISRYLAYALAQLRKAQLLGRNTMYAFILLILLIVVFVVLIFILIIIVVGIRHFFAKFLESFL
jgi:hypothetical protein